MAQEALLGQQGDGKMKMKQIISLLVALCLVVMPAVALVDYTGNPSMPYLVYGFVNWNDQLLSGTRLEITNQGTGMVKIIATNSDGYWQEDAMSWLTSSGYRLPIQGGDVIKVKALDGCGTGDTCEKTFIAFSGDKTEYYKAAGRVDLSLTGELVCPPVSCPSCGSCDCGGGGSSCSGGGTVCDYSYSKEICNNKYPCIKESCPELITCPEEKVCPELNCPPCIESICPECSDIPSGLTGGQIIIFLISLLGVGGVGGFLGTKLTNDKIERVRNVTYRVRVERDHDIVEEHRHAGIRSYHSINTSHREEHERHKKGERFPLYEKDVDGVYKYVE